MRSTPTCRLNTASNVTEMMSNGRKVATGRAASEAVAIVSAPQPTMPARNTQTRAVPRDRPCRAGPCILRVHAASCVSTPPLRFRDLRPIHLITELERWSFLHNSWRKNCVVLMRLSARMPLIVMKKTGFWIGALALAGVLGAGAVPAEAAAAKKKTAKTTQARRLYASSSSLNRRASSARARAVAMAREMADTPLPRYKVDASGDLVPDLRAAAAIIYDPETNQVLWEENSQNQRSIASITKVMTASCSWKSNPDLRSRSPSRAATCSRRRRRTCELNDQRDGRRPAAPAADRVGQRRGPRAGAGVAARVRRLHRADEREGRGARSRDHALRGSVGPAVGQRVVGLRHGAAHHATRRTTSASRRSCGRPSTRSTPAAAPITFHSTNHLLGRADVDVRAGKTGFISKSGYCLATLLRLPQSGQQVAVVVLGARSNAGRFMETQNLFNWLSTKAATARFAAEYAASPRSPG